MNGTVGQGKYCRYTGEGVVGQERRGPRVKGRYFLEPSPFDNKVAPPSKVANHIGALTSASPWCHRWPSFGCAMWMPLSLTAHCQLRPTWRPPLVVSRLDGATAVVWSARPPLRTGHRKIKSRGSRAVACTSCCYAALLYVELRAVASQRISVWISSLGFL